MGEPNPYLAVLVADGDKMGAAISELASADEHRKFSELLARFADEAQEIVKCNNGVLVYAGGDDVIAFLPLHTYLCCARALRDKFVECLRPQVPDNTPTLSVGIAIGHFMENLEDLLEYGRAAEKAAKSPDRNGLAIHLHKRGGAPIGVRASWNENPDERLKKFAKLMNDGIIPTKLPYELRAMAKLYEKWPEKDAEAAIEVDLIRLIAKKASRGMETVKHALSEHLKEMNLKKLKALALELLVARILATAITQAEGKS